MLDDGIYYVGREILSDGTITHQLRRYEFTTHRTVDVGPLSGEIDEWIGGLAVSNDHHTILYSHRVYESREVVLVDHFP